MDVSYQERSEDSNSITSYIAEEAALLGDGTNKEIFAKIERLKAFQEKVLSVLGTAMKRALSSAKNWLLPFFNFDEFPAG